MLKLLKKILNDKLSTVFYVIVVLLIVLFYILGELYFCSSRFTDMITNIIAIIVGGTFWIEYRRNKLESQQNNKTMEAQFIMDLNNQFIGNKDLMDVEFELEKYYYKYKNKELTEEYNVEFLKHFAIDNRERQKLVSYLVHLEGIAALVNNKVINLDVINDLMAYRYFIAINNPLVQNLELNEYHQYYRGCFAIYNKWKNVYGENEIPMKEFEPKNLVENNKKIEVI